MLYNVGFTQKAYAIGYTPSKSAKPCLYQYRDTIKFTSKNVDEVKKDEGVAPEEKTLEEKTLEKTEELDFSQLEYKKKWYEEQGEDPFATKDEITRADIEELKERYDASSDKEDDCQTSAVHYYKKILRDSFIAMKLAAKSKKELSPEDKTYIFSEALEIAYRTTYDMDRCYRDIGKSDKAPNAKNIALELETLSKDYDKEKGIKKSRLIS